MIDCLGSSIEREYGFKKQEQLKNPKYIEMRMDELYPVKKARPWMHSGKDISKVLQPSLILDNFSFCV